MSTDFADLKTGDWFSCGGRQTDGLCAASHSYDVRDGGEQDQDHADGDEGWQQRKVPGAEGVEDGVLEDAEGDYGDGD